MTENKRFGYDCNFKDDKDFCHALKKPEVCRPGICFYGLGEINEDDLDE